MTTNYFNTANTEGFTQSDLDTLNAALEAVLADYPAATSELEQSVGDALNNAWVEGATVSDLVATVSGRF